MVVMRRVEPRALVARLKVAMVSEVAPRATPLVATRLQVSRLVAKRLKAM
jgi:hypothetical protein